MAWPGVMTLRNLVEGQWPGTRTRGDPVGGKPAPRNDFKWVHGESHRHELDAPEFGVFVFAFFSCL